MPQIYKKNQNLFSEQCKGLSICKALLALLGRQNHNVLIIGPKHLILGQSISWSPLKVSATTDLSRVRWNVPQNIGNKRKEPQEQLPIRNKNFISAAATGSLLVFSSFCWWGEPPEVA